MVLITTTRLLNSFHTAPIFTIARALLRYVPSPRHPRRSRGRRRVARCWGRPQQWATLKKKSGFKPLHCIYVCSSWPFIASVDNNFASTGSRRRCRRVRGLAWFSCCSSFSIWYYSNTVWPIAFWTWTWLKKTQTKKYHSIKPYHTIQIGDQ